MVRGAEDRQEGDPRTGDIPSMLETDRESHFSPQANLAGKVDNIKSRKSHFKVGAKCSCYFICLSLQCDIRYPQKEYLHGNIFLTQWACPQACHKKTPAGLPGGAVVENPPANAGDTGSSPGPGRSHMPRSS